MSSTVQPATRETRAGWRVRVCAKTALAASSAIDWPMAPKAISGADLVGRRVREGRGRSGRGTISTHSRRRRLRRLAAELSTLDEEARGCDWDWDWDWPGRGRVGEDEDGPPMIATEDRMSGAGRRSWRRSTSPTAGVTVSASSRASARLSGCGGGVVSRRRCCEGCAVSRIVRLGQRTTLVAVESKEHSP